MKHAMARALPPDRSHVGTEQRHPGSMEFDALSVQACIEVLAGDQQRAIDAVLAAAPEIAAFVGDLIPRMMAGGRLLYAGAGTSGRLGVVDASEIPPTYGAPPDWVVGIIAGGDHAIRNPVEGAEDSATQAWEDLRAWQIEALDTVVGIAASGTTPYVVHGLRACRAAGIRTACITCNPGAPVIDEADYPILAVVGPEFVTGSTRMKAGTAQKLILNMISTTAMIQLGRVLDNKMVDMQLSNAKLIERGARMVAEATGLPLDAAREALLQHGSVRKAVASVS